MNLIYKKSAGSRNQDPQAIKITRSNLRVTINHNSVTTIAKDYK